MMHTLLVVWHVMSAQLVIVPTPQAYNFGTFQDRAFFLSLPLFSEVNRHHRCTLISVLSS